MGNAQQVQESVDALVMLRRTSKYAGFRATARWLATLGYLALGLYAGTVLALQDFAFGIVAVLSCLASAAGLHVTVQVILILVDIADAQIGAFRHSLGFECRKFAFDPVGPCLGRGLRRESPRFGAEPLSADNGSRFPVACLIRGHLVYQAPVGTPMVQVRREIGWLGRILQESSFH